MSVVKEHTVCRQTSECLGISFSGAREVRHPQLGLLLVFLLDPPARPWECLRLSVPSLWILRVPGGSQTMVLRNCLLSVKAQVIFVFVILYLDLQMACCMFRNKFVLIAQSRLSCYPLKQVNLYKNYQNLLSLKHPDINFLRWKISLSFCKAFPNIPRLSELSSLF